MTRAFTAVAMALALAGCATAGGVATPHADLERAEIAAEAAFQAGVPFYTPVQKDKAWADLMEVRKLYNASQPIAAAVAQVQSDSDAAKGTK